MLTSQQVEMQEKLQSLIEKHLKFTVESNGLSDGQRFFRYLLKKYLGTERYEKAAFKRRTGLQKNVYYKLSGYSKIKEGEPVKEETLFDVAIGLGLTYEEALVLFTFWGKNLLCDFQYMQEMNKDLLELDS